jgi:hypothetical protein
MALGWRRELREFGAHLSELSHEVLDSPECSLHGLDAVVRLKVVDGVERPLELLQVEVTESRHRMLESGVLSWELLEVASGRLPPPFQVDLPLRRRHRAPLARQQTVDSRERTANPLSIEPAASPTQARVLRAKSVPALVAVDQYPSLDKGVCKKRWFALRVIEYEQVYRPAHDIGELGLETDESLQAGVLQHDQYVDIAVRCLGSGREGAKQKRKPDVGLCTQRRA